MTKSMTSYARESVNLETLNLVIEMRGLNNKYLDVICKVPESFAFLEEDIIKLISTKVGRGRIECRLSYKHSSTEKNYKIDQDTLHSLIVQAKQLAKKFDIATPDNLQYFLQLPGVIVEERVEREEDVIKEVIIPKIDNVLEQFVKMRQGEGMRLQEDIIKRLNLVEEYIDDIEALSEVVIVEYRDKLRKRIEKLGLEGDLEENRLMMEVAIFAEKSSITEELVRLNSHLKEFQKTLNSSEGTIGRKLDFIVQEINRETNTIGSKSHNYDINKLVVNIKSEIEKIREQIQNIE
ncbi:YicC/YloC family endoribonuclease [Proteinivorax tanatarense]|uniref:YicC/YloC family endoribonuclease n=1 Tax=Proteinivorax tanatarense TaxID=1260629 RepID=A0AAU7VPZ3_9FIRM